MSRVNPPCNLQKVCYTSPNSLLRRLQCIRNPPHILPRPNLRHNLPLNQRQRQRPKSPRIPRLREVIPQNPAMTLRHLHPQPPSSAHRFSPSPLLPSRRKSQTDRPTCTIILPPRSTKSPGIPITLLAAPCPGACGRWKFTTSPNLTPLPRRYDLST